MGDSHKNWVAVEEDQDIVHKSRRHWKEVDSKFLEDHMRHMHLDYSLEPKMSLPCYEEDSINCKGVAPWGSCPLADDTHHIKLNWRLAEEGRGLAQKLTYSCRIDKANNLNSCLKFEDSYTRYLFASTFIFLGCVIFYTSVNCLLQVAF